MVAMEELLNRFVSQLEQAFGDDLVSVVLYGSAAAGDYQENVSDLNILCVLKTVGTEQLSAAYPAVDEWMKKKQPAPTLLSVEEIERASDAFAIEFVDISKAYRVLHGCDVAAGIEVDPAHHRHQVEHELRSRLLRLRGRYLALQKDRRQLIALMCDSLPTFATLLRHATLLAGGEAFMKKHEVFQEAVRTLGIESRPFERLLAVREGEKLTDAEIGPLFESYLRQITAAAEFVDRLDQAQG
jgi:predicted nucleotidyltransferase